MKEILLSVKPEHLAKILNGEKTLEIRKTIPKCELPCKVWLYCSKGKKNYHLCKLYKDNKIPYYTYEKYEGWGCMPNPIDGKVVGYFILNKVRCFEAQCSVADQNSIYEIKGWYGTYLGELQDNNLDILKESCLTFEQLEKYLQDKNGDILDKKFYAWEIENLTILDKPFSLLDDEHLSNPKAYFRISKAPQSWCYCCHSILIK